ncbi:hypothetical protein HYQ46_002676 [Verticillium longisporum]|nr:hypothetical protein HYQ46_002676 [Verticillium longisporum]
MRLAGAARLLVPRCQELVHALGQQALGVHLDAKGLDAQGTDGFEGGREAVLLGEDRVTPVAVAEHAQGLLEGAGAADCLTHLPVCVRWVVDQLDWP